MAYLPKSKYEVLYTNGNEYRLLKSSTPYIGNYLKLYDGRTFAGDSISSPKGVLVQIDRGFTKNVLNNTDNNRIYSILKPKLSREQDEYISIKSNTPFPTEEDYKKGFFIRHFSVRLNTKGYQEINKTTFQNFYKKNYNRKLYKVFQLKWSLTPNSEIENSNSLKIYESKLPGISNMFPNNTQYRRNNPNNTSILENLIANQGELFYLDGRPYPEGALYHMHPIKGPMVGATHIPEFHASLSYSSVPSFPQTSGEVPLPPTTPPPPLTPPPPPPPSTSQPTSSPSNGGGGY